MELTNPVDIHSLEQSMEVLKNFGEITTLLRDSQERNVEIRSRLFRALAKHEVSTKLSERGQEIELIKKGEEKLVDEYLESETEVSNLKHAWKYAEHAVNMKKHINLISPKG